MSLSCYLLADVKPGKVLLTSVKALTSFADLCQTSRSWMRSFNTECCSIEDKKKKCQHNYLVEHPTCSFSFSFKEITPTNHKNVNNTKDQS